MHACSWHVAQDCACMRDREGLHVSMRRRRRHQATAWVSHQARARRRPPSVLGPGALRMRAMPGSLGSLPDTFTPRFRSM